MVFFLVILLLFLKVVHGVLFFGPLVTAIIFQALVLILADRGILLQTAFLALSIQLCLAGRARVRIIAALLLTLRQHVHFVELEVVILSNRINHLNLTLLLLLDIIFQLFHPVCVP